MLLFVEGFSANNPSNLVALGKWTALNSLAQASGAGSRFSGTAYITGTNRNNYIRRNTGSNLASGVVAIAFRYSASVNTKGNIVVLTDLGTVQIGLGINADGTLTIFRTTWATILGTSTYVMPGDTWVFIELKFKISDSIASGDVVVYADGVAVLTLAAASDTKNTANAYITDYIFMGTDGSLSGAGSNTYYFTDHYLLDLTGSVNNAPLGNCRVQTLFPSGNGNSNIFTGSDGNTVNNYQQIDDTQYASADYNDGLAVNDKDTYAFGDTGVSTATIFGVGVNVIAKKTDVGARGVKPVIRHSSTDYDGTEILLTSTDVQYSPIYETNPGTGSGWTKSGVDNAEFGLKVST